MEADNFGPDAPIFFQVMTWYYQDMIAAHEALTDPEQVLYEEIKEHAEVIVDCVDEL